MPHPIEVKLTRTSFTSHMNDSDPPSTVASFAKFFRT